ncbi:MAG: DUF4252 domain-containing protein [Bacteroides sp.]|nr:DUF4252 domain-containing protein [Bacteroides sp.]
MKTKIFMLVLVLSFVCTGTIHAQKSFDKIFKHYKKQENIIGIKINKLGCKILSWTDVGDKAGSDFLKKSSSLRILVVEDDRNNELQTDLAEYISYNKLEKLMEVMDGDDAVDMYILDKNEVIHQLLFVISDKKEKVVLYVEGKYPFSMIQEIIADNSKMKAKVKKNS